jgi:outer membrane protein assembly factor BamB
MDMTRRLIAAGLALTLQACGSGGGDGATDVATAQMAVVYQIDPGRAGVAAISSPAFPSAPAWTRTFDGLLSYPLIAEGAVFVLVWSGSGSAPTRLHALSKANGADLWAPVAISGTYAWGGHAYAEGRVFVGNSDGVMRALDAATGQSLWTVQLTSSSLSSAPSAAHGAVYVTGSGAEGLLHAVDQRTGAIRWTKPIAGGGGSAPAVSSDAVFVSSPCNTEAFDARTGARRWHADAHCVGGGGRTPALSSDSLYVRDAGPFPDATVVVRNSRDGAPTSSNTAFGLNLPLPLAVTSTAVFVVSEGRLQRFDQAMQNQLWSFGDGSLVTAPIVIDTSVVVVSSNGTVFAIDAATGSPTWSAQLASRLATGPSEDASVPLTGPAAGEGHLLVPAWNSLTAWKLVP